MTSQILKSLDFSKTQKSRYLKDETWFFLQKKNNHRLHIRSYFITKNSFVAEVTFKNEEMETKKLPVGLQDIFKTSILSTFVS